jgi:hypothetical protein
VSEFLAGEGSLEKDMRRLGELAHTKEAQFSIERLIELGAHYERKTEFELGLPDNEARIWET